MGKIICTKQIFHHKICQITKITTEIYLKKSDLLSKKWKKPSSKRSLKKEPNKVEAK